MWPPGQNCEPGHLHFTLHVIFLGCDSPVSGDTQDVSGVKDSLVTFLFHVKFLEKTIAYTS